MTVVDYSINCICASRLLMEARTHGIDKPTWIGSVRGLSLSGLVLYLGWFCAIHVWTEADAGAIGARSARLNPENHVAVR